MNAVSERSTMAPSAVCTCVIKCPVLKKLAKWSCDYILSKVLLFQHINFTSVLINFGEHSLHGYLGSLVTEDCRSCHEVRRRMKASNKKRYLIQGSLSHYLMKHGETICLECCVIWKQHMDTAKRRYSMTLGIWNMDLEAYDESTMDWA